MKENSIEEDIKKLEEEVKRVNKINNLTGTYVPIHMLESFLSDYKRVLKENEELKEIYRSEKKMKNEYIKLYQDLLLKENVIPVQKVKDKIEEKEWAIKSYDCDTANYKQSQAIGAWQVLQELLEGRK